MRITPLKRTKLSLGTALILLILSLASSVSLNAQTSTEFWFAPPELTQGHGGTGSIFVRLASGAAGATVTIDMPANPGALNGGNPITVVLGPNESQTVNLTSFINILETRPQATVLSTGLYISSTENITAIYEAGPNNNVDIWALKGSNGLGTEFYAPMQNLWPQGNYNPNPYTSFDIVATEDNTTILIFPTSDLDLPNGGNGDAAGQPAFQSFTITLNRGETYSAAVTDRDNPENNPSGSIIVSDKPIAVSIKDDSISPPTQGCREAVGDQIVPVDIVGNEYIVNKGGLNAGSREWAYVVATQNNTQISVDGVLEATLFNAETYPIEITNDLTYITGDKNFYLIHISGFGCESGMAQLPPLNCAGSEQVSFTRSTSESFFINLLVPAGAEDAFTLTNGAGTDIPIDPADFDVVPGTGGAWVGAQIQFNTSEIAVGNANFITNSEEVFSLGLINGGASSGCRFGYFSEFASEIIVDAGPDQTVCANRDTELAGSVTGGATNGEWSTNGTGIFIPDATAFDAIYEPSLADLSAGVVTLTLTSVSNCFPVEDEVVITYTPAPVVIAGADIEACENNTTVTLDGFVDVASGGIWSGGGGTFDPTTGTLDAEYTPTAAEVTNGSVTLTLTSTGNGTCFAESDEVEITFGPAPTADAGADQVLCGNNANAQLLGAVTIATGGEWTGGTGTYNPSAQSLSPIYTPSPTEILNGSVTLTLNTTGNGGCVSVTDNVLLTFTDAPTVDAGSDQSFCRNNADIPLNGSITVASGGLWTGGTGTFNPDANTLNAVYTPSLPELLAGTVTLTLTTTGNGDCNAVADNVTFTFTDAPIVNAGADGNICSNNPNIALNGSLVGANFGIWSGGAGSFSPSTTALNAVYTPTAGEISSGNVTLTLTSLDNGTCNPVVDNVTYTFTPSPIANAGPDQDVCENNADILLAGSVSIAAGGQWSGGAGTFTPDANTLNATYTPTAGEIFAGSVNLTLTTTGNGSCLAETDNVLITFTDAPTANAGVDQTLCANNAVVSLAGGVTLATGGQWTGGLGTFTPNANDLNATYEPTATEIASGSLTLTLTTTGNADCNPVSDSMVITFTPSPVVDAGAPISVCANNAQVTLNGSVSIAGGGTWSGGAGTFIPNANALNALYTPTPAEIASGSLILTLTSTSNGNCNPVEDVVSITFTPAPTANAGLDQTVCGNDPTVNLNGVVTVATSGVWTGGGGSFNPNNTTLGATYTPSPAEIAAGSVTLTLTTTANGNCTAVNDQMIITITPAPTVEAGAGSEVCSNNPDINLNGSITIATGGTWSGGSGTFTPAANSLNAVYTPSQTEINNGSVTLTLTSTGNGDCLAVTDNVTFTFGPSPTANAGVNQILCSNNAEISLNGSVTVAGGGQWSGGLGTFTPSANALNAVYTPTAAEISSGSITLTLTTTSNGGCLAATDNVLITFTPAPTANAGADQTVCANDPQVNLTGSVTIASGGQWSGGSGAFSPSSNSLFATYIPSADEIAAGSATLTLTTTGNGDCNAVSDQVTITITPAPTANAGADATFCANNSDISLNGIVTVASGGSWSGGNGTFNPDGSTLNATYTPTQSELNNGSVTLTLTTTGNGDCLAVTDNVTYSFTPAPTVNAGSNIVVCSNNPQFSLNGSLTVAGGATWSGGSGTFTPNANALNATYTPTQAEIDAGTLVLTLTTTGNGNCIAVSDQVEISFSPSPTANAGTDISVCANDPEVNLTGSVTIATGGVWSGGFGAFNPSPNSLFTTYTPSLGEIAAGTVTLTLTTTGNGNCNAVSDQVVITITPAPTANAGADDTFCANNADISLNGSVTVATGGTWSGGSGTFNPSASDLNAVYTPSQTEINNGSVSLTLTTTGNGNCLAVTDAVTYTLTPSPTANAGADIDVCSNNPAFSLSGSVAIATGGVWSGGAGSFNPGASALNATYTPTQAEIDAGTLTLTLTTTGNGDCNAVTDQVEITFGPSPTANAGADVTVCANDPEVNLNGQVTVASGGIWSGGTGSFSPNNTTLGATYVPSAIEIANGSVTLTLTTTGNGDCNSVTDQVTITITPAPTANAGADDTFCANNADIQLNGSVTVATGGTWSGGNGTFDPDGTTLNAIYTPTQSELNNGSITLTLTTLGNGNCLAVSDAVTFTLTPAPTANAGSDIDVCSNNADVALSGSVTTATGGTWSGGAGSFAPNANALNATYTPTQAEIDAGTLTLTLTTTGNDDCNAVTDEVEITFGPSPTANAGTDVTICANDPEVNLNGQVTVATGGVWSGGTGTFNPNNTTLGATYTPSLAEIANGSVTLTLTTTGNGDCNSVTDQVTITITPAPTANAGADDTFCANNADIQLNGSVTVATGGTWSGGNGTFDPDGTTLNAIYSPTQSELNNGSITLTLTTLGNGNCLAVSDAVTFTLTPAPTVNAGVDIEVCSNNADVSLNGSVTIATGGTWSGGAGSFSPDVNTLNATYTPIQAEIDAGSLILTLTSSGNGDCNAVTDQVEITFDPSPTANAGADVTVCANDPEVNLNGQVTVATGGVWSGGTGSFSPNNTTLGATYIPSAVEIANGSVTLTLTTTGNGDCNSESDQVLITITPAPVVDAGTGADFCENNPEIPLNGSVTVASGGIWSGGSGTFTPNATTLNAVYTPSQTELNNGTLTLTLTSTGNGNCLAVEDMVTYTFSPAPTASAGADQTLCANNANVSLNGSVTVATGGVWSGGTGTFAPNANTLNAVYTPSAADITAGNVTLTLTTTGNGNCLPVSDALTITFTPAPTVNAGVDQTVCGNDPEVNLSGSVSIATGGTWSGGFGSFSPDANSLFTTYTPSLGEIAAGTVTLTLSTTGNGNCTPVTDQITITITPAPTANAGSDQTFCANNADIPLNGAVTVASGGIWSGGNGSFNPDLNTLDAIYTPSIGEITSGAVTLTLTTTGNGDCNAVTDQVTFNFTPAPTISVGADQTLCANNSAASLSASITVAGGVTWSGGAGSFSPNVNSLNPTYTPTPAEISAGNVTLTATTTGNGICSPVSDNITLNFTPSPTANAGADQSVCANNSSVNLTGSVTIASGGTWSGGFGSFSPDANSLFATYSPSLAEIAAGTVTLTLTTTGNGNCTPVTDQITITITPAPTVDAGVGEELCANNAEISLNGNVTIATGATWSGGGGTFSPDPNTLNAVYTPTQGEITAGTVTLILTSTGNGNCSGVTDNVTYTFGPAPVVDAGSNQTLCANNAQVSLSGSVTNAGGAIWSGGSGTFTPNENTPNATYTPTAAEIAAGSLTLTLTSTGNGDCLPESDDVVITFSPAPTVNAGVDQTVCANDPSVNLNGQVTVATGGVWSGGGGSFSPNNTTLGATYTPSPVEIANGGFTLTLTSTGNGDCNSVSDVVSITITPAPTADAGVGFELCSNNPEISLNGSVTVATGGIWSGGNGTFTPNANDLQAVYNPSQSEINNGSVTLTLTTSGNGDCLAVTDNVTYTFGPSPIVNAGPNQTLCANNSQATLAGSVTNAGGGTWSGGAGSFSPNPNTPNATYTPTAAEILTGALTLTFTSTGNGNCIAVSDDVTLTFTPAPTANAGMDVTVCGNNATVNLNGQVTVATGGIWTGGNGTFNPNNTTLGAVYTPSPAEIAAGTVTLTLSTTGNGNCNPTTDQLVITITPPPVVDAGVGEELCSNNADITLSGSVTGATGGTWSGGSGTFTPNANTLDAVYTPSAGEITSGSLTLTLTSTGNSNCIAVTDAVTYTFGPAPTANAGVDQTLCANNANVSLNGSVTVATGGTWSGGAGTFSPNANSLTAVYTPTAAELTAGTVTLILTTTGNDDCNAVSDNIVINFTPAPTASAGSDQTVCANNPIVSLNGSVTIATGGTWSGGTGTFSDVNVLNPTYTPSAAELVAGTVTLTLSTTGNGNCNPTTDNMVITITPAPVVDAGVGEELCSNNANITLGGSVTGATGGTWSGGSGTFTPNANTLNAVYTPSAGEITAGSVTLILTSTGNGNCVPEDDNVTYTFSPAPTASAGADQTLCANNANVSLNGSVTIATGGTWSGGAGSFSPNANSLTAVYAPTAAELAAGTVTLTLTTTGNDDCNAVSDNIVINFTPAPTASAGSDQTVCANNPIVSLNGSVTIATGGTWSGGTGTFSDVNVLNPTYTPNAAELLAGTVTLTLSTTGNGNCNPTTDQMVITITPAPVVDAGVGEELCSNNANITLGGSVTGATGGTWSGGSGTFTPNANTLNAVYSPSAGEITAGSVTLILTSTGNGNCVPEDDNVTYTFSPAPTANAGADQTLCANNANVSLNGSVTVATGGTWSGGTGSFSPNANSLTAVYTPTAAELTTGTVTLTLTTTGNDDCNAVSDAITINFTPAPTANAGADVTVCANNANVNLNGSVTVATGGSWSGGAGTFTPDANTLNAAYTPSPAEIAAGTVTLTLSTTGNGNCNPTTDNMVITITPAPVVDAGVGEELCSNNANITLGGSVTGATGGTWSGGSGTFTPNANTLDAVYTPSAGEITSGSLTLTLTSTGNSNCIAVTDAVTYTFGPAPTANAGSDQTLCANNANVSLNGSVTVATGGTWSGGAGTFSPNANSLTAVYTPTAAELTAGTVTLILTTTGNDDCNAVSDNIVINFTPAPTASAGSDQTVCANNPIVSLNGSVTIATGGTWSGGTGTFSDINVLNPTYTPSAAELVAGTVTLTLSTTGNGNCNPTTDNMVITITPAPVVDAGVGEELCSNNANITLGGSVTGATGGTWSGGSGTFTPNANTLNAVYTPSAGEITAGSVTLILTSTGNGNCVPEDDNVTYTFSPAPTASAGADQTLCANNANVSLNGSVTIATGGTWSGGAGSFSPNANSLTAVYTPTAAELTSGTVTLTLATTGNGTCLPVSDNVVINFTPAPTANAGADVIVCANNANVNLNGSVTVATGGSWSGGAGTFTPDANTLNAAYTPSPAEIAAGTVTLTLSTTGNGNCNPTTDNMVITITPAPVVDAGVGEELCSNNANITLGGSVTGATGGTWSGGSGTFTPNANTLDAVYTPSAGEITSGSLTLTLTSTGNSNCIAVTDAVTYTFGPAPTANAGSDQILCANNANVSLNGSVTVATGGTWSGGTGSFSPNANSLTAVYTPTAAELTAGTVTLILTTTGNDDCNAVSDNIVITFTPAPTVNAGIDRAVCANNSEVALNGSFSVASGAIWSGGSGTFAPDANTVNAVYTPSPAEIAAGVVNLTLTTIGNGNCLAVSDQMVITINPEPIVNAGADLSICSNNSVFDLSGSVLNAGGGQWSGGLGTFNPSNTDLNATYTPTTPEIIAGSVIFTLTSTSNGGCLAVSDQVVVTFTPSPTVDAGEDITLCASTPVASLNGSFSVSGGAQWSGGAGTFVPNVLTMNATYTPTPAEVASGSVTLTLTTISNGNCVPELDEVTIFFDPEPTISAGPNLTSCANNPIVALNGNFSNSEGVEWSGGTGFFDPNNEDPQANYTPSNAEILNGFATLTLTSFGTGSCPEISDAMNITINPAPIVNAGTNIEVCSNNNTVNLSGSIQFAAGGQWTGGAGSFLPNNSSLTATYIPSAAEVANGFVTLTLTSVGNGTCQPVTDQVTITFTPAPLADAGTDIEICENNATVQLNGSFTVAEGANWSGGAGSFNPDNSTINAFYTPSATEIANGSVTLTLTTFGNGDCVPASDQMTISFTPEPVVVAGDDIFVCVDDLVADLSGSVSGGTTTGVWNTSGSGVFIPNASTLNASYQVSSADSLIGEVTLTLTSTNNGTCTTVEDVLTVFILPAGTANAGEDQVICSNNPVASLSGIIGGAATEGEWSTSGTGAFSPNNTENNVNYIPSEADLISGSVLLTFSVNSCNLATDDVIITYSPSPIVNAGSDITLCSSEIEAQLTGSVSGPSSTGIWSSNGSGVFLPNATDLNATYQWSAADIANQVVEIVLTSTDIGNCLEVTDTLILNIFPQGTANAGPDVTACANNPEVQLEGVLTGADIPLWTTSGSGSFAPSPDSLNTTYVPSDDDISNGSVQLVLNAVNSCNLASDFMEVSFVPSPIPDAGPDQAICGEVIPFQINGSVQNAGGAVWSTSGSGTFQNASNLSTFYVASQGDIDNEGVFLILTSIDNGTCFPESDSLFIDISTGIEVDAGGDREACINSGSIQLFGTVSNGTTTGIWSTTGDGIFTPSANAINAVYQFTQNDIDNGPITLTLTSTNNGICDEESDSFSLSFGDVAFVFAGDDIEVCETTDLVELNGIISGETNTGIWSTTGDGSFFPNATTLDAFYEPGPGDFAAGSVDVTLTSTNSVLCNEGSSSLTIVFQPLPVANAGIDRVVCGAIQPVQLTGQASNATGGFWQTSGSGTFSPDPNTLTATYTPSVADSIIGDITLTLTTTGNGDCIADTDQMIISFSGAVVPVAGPDQEVCEDVAFVELEGSVNGSNSFNWSSNGGGTFDPDATSLITSYVPVPEDIEAGSIQIFLSAVGNENCPTTLDSLTLSFDRIPVVDIPDDISVCITDPSVQVSTDVDFADGVLWSSTGSGLFSPDNISEDVVYEPSAADLASGGVTLTIEATSEGVCGTTTESVNVDFRDLAQVNAGQDQVVCETDGLVSLSGTIGGAGYEPVWTTSSFGSFDPDNSVLDPNYIFAANDILIGEATLILTSGNNGPCEAVSDTVFITINPTPQVDAGSDDFICRSTGLVSLNGTVDNATSSEWTTLGDGVFLPSGEVLDPEYVVGNLDGINEEVQLVLNAEGLEGCAAAADTVLITINNPVEADFSFSASCVGAPTQFTDQSKVLAGSIIGWTWNFGNGNISNQQNPVFAFTEEGTPSVQLVVRSSLGCNDTITQFLTVVQGPTAAFLVSENPAPINFEVDFQDASSDAVNWAWNFGDDFGTANTQNASYSYDEEGDYIVTLLVTGSTGCVDSAQTNLTVSGELILPPRIPNSFSPNGDGRNDVFFVRGGPFLELDFRVYDSWGAEIFATRDQEIGWDGFMNGKQAPVGVYVYTINAVNLEGESFESTGKVNLFR